VPIYEYYCSDCRSKFEVLTSYEASKGEMLCATCHSTNVRKLISAFARTRHGSGDDSGDFGGADADDFGGDDFEGSAGGCSCGGGACGCHN
jgi:putative FmdB family regulatory protein